MTGPIPAAEPCCRCNGRGGWEGWPNFTCYRCGGTGVEPRKEVRVPRPKRCRTCGASEGHWNGLYARQCPTCDVNHGKEACPRCGAPHPDLATRQLPACYQVTA